MPSWIGCNPLRRQFSYSVKALKTQRDAPSFIMSQQDHALGKSWGKETRRSQVWCMALHVCVCVSWPACANGEGCWCQFMHRINFVQSIADFCGTDWHKYKHVGVLFLFNIQRGLLSRCYVRGVCAAPACFALNKRRWSRCMRTTRQSHAPTHMQTLAHNAEKLTLMDKFFFNTFQQEII